MNKGQVRYAERKAMENFDRWNEVVGMFKPTTGYYAEIEGVIEDAVHIGIQMALKGELSYDEDGNVKRTDNV